VTQSHDQEQSLCEERCPQEEGQADTAGDQLSITSL